MTPIAHIRRNILKVSQAELGELAGVKQSTVSRWEAGTLAPDVTQVERIVLASAGEVRVEDFFSDNIKAVSQQEAA